MTYQLEELIATKLRALYQRRKGRDLFDVAHVFHRNLVDKELVLELFREYCEREGVVITRDLFYANMKQKRLHTPFQVDVIPLLPEGVSWNFDEAFEFVQDTIIALLPE